MILILGFLVGWAPDFGFSFCRDIAMIEQKARKAIFNHSLDIN